ncbi:sensor histidine kinase [Massilia aerilata]|uniref:Sensor histidine kinase n=1 Tax=Massilia aerilata TaxID=453817 RepID=A0ABW0S3S6_9BURK
MNPRDDTAAAAVRRLYGCSARQGMLSLVHLCVFVAGAAWLQRYSLIGLFAAILAPMLLACALLLLGARVFASRFGWREAWGALVFASTAGSLAALPAYRAWMTAHGSSGLPNLQVLACAFGISILVLGLPLRQAQVRAHAQQLAELRHAVLAAELKALQAQVEPHFLYNTLANTRYLARQDPERAAQMLEHLIAYLHSALPDMRSRDSTLGREFDLAGHYLALMAIRFGERLRYRLDCPPGLAGMPVPPLLLMTLVENAVKHGVERKPGAVSVTLDAQRAGAAVTIVVGDDGAGLVDAALGSGVGLRNLRQRLAALYGGRAAFDLRRTSGGITEAVLTLPCMKLEMAA